jgi:hypothetical protein
MSTKKTRGKSKSPKKSPASSQINNVLKDDELDEICENITLKRPRTSYTHFCMDEIEKFKKKNKNEKIDLKTFSKECAQKWKELSKKEKNRYKEQFEEDKTKYKNDLEKVRHYLFKDYNDIVHRPPTAYRIFLNEKLREGFEKNLDPKKIKAQASKDWRMMEQEEKQVYLDKKKDNDDWFERAKKTRKVTALSLFVQKTIEEAKNKHKDIPKLAEIAPAWKQLPSSEKKKYKDYADDINEERERLADTYELVNGIKPKRPAGAFRCFLQEKAKEKALHSLKEGKELWDKLSEDEKEKYLKRAHRCRLAYIYKKMIYNKKIKKILPKRPANAYGYFLKDKKGQKIPKGEKAVVYWRKEFDDLPKDKLKKYKEKAAKEKERYEKKMDEFKNVVFDMPKRPVNAFSLYVKDRVPDLRKENENEPVQKLIKIAAKEWKEEDGVSQSKYEKKAEYEKKKFLKQLKDFKKYGYYKKNYRAERTQSKTKRGRKEESDEDEDEDEELDEESEEEEKPKRKPMKKKRSTSASSKRGSKKSKTQDTKRRKSSNKKGKTQKKK